MERMKKSRSGRETVSGRFARGIAITLLALTMGACAGKGTQKSVFWPPPPDFPRVQYLKSIKDSTDVVESKAFSLLSLGDDSATLVPILKPYGLAVKDGKIYVCDTVQAELLTIDLPNRKMTKLAGNVNAGRLKKPVNVGLDEAGNIYVADTSRHEVLQYGPDGAFLQTFGRGMEMKPVDVGAEENFVYILDQTKSELHIFDRSTGDFMKSIGRSDDPLKRMAGPTNMATDGKGALYVSNFGNGRIIKLDRDGNFLMGYGRLGSNFGEFGRPRGIAVDKDGLIYVVDAASQLVQIFDDQFRLLMFFGAPGTAGSLNIPAGIAVSTDNLDYYQKLADSDFILEKVVFVANQAGDNKINIYGIGKKRGLDYEVEVKKALEEQKKKEEEALEKARKAKEEKEKEKLEQEKKKEQKGATPEPAVTK